MPKLRKSPKAADELFEAVESGDITATSYDADDYMGATDCPEGCVVEPDGHCPHGFESAGLTAGLI